MEQFSTLCSCEMIKILRCRLEEAFDQGDYPAAQALSRQMDDIQLHHWAAVLAPAS